MKNYTKISYLSITLLILVTLIFPYKTFAIPTLYAPWDYDDRWIAGNGCYGGGSYYNEGAHVGSDSYAIDFNGRLESDCDLIESDDGKNIRAANSGTVDSIGTNPLSSYGYYVIIDHGSGFKSRYAHLKYNSTSSPGISVGQKIYRGQVIGFNGETGSASGPHLHFVLYDFAGSNGNSVKPNPIDGVTLDTGDEGALVLSTNLPTFTGTINSNYTLDRFSSPIVVDGSVTLAASASLTVQPGAIVKLKSGSLFTINGNLDVNGTSASRSYFTSYTDDTVGGDTNANGLSTGSFGYWDSIQFNSGATGSFDYTTIRFGGGYGTTWSSIYANGGTIDIDNSLIASATYNAMFAHAGSVTIENSILKDNNDNGISIDHIGSITLNNNTFIDNTNYPAIVDLSSNKAFSASNNTSSGSGKKGFRIFGYIDSNQTWDRKMPYIIGGSLTVNSGKTLTIDPGTIVKFEGGYEGTNAYIAVNGELDVNGTYASRSYFTALRDDTVGGDTNGDSTGTSPASGSWNTIRLNSGSSTSFDYAVVRYGGGTTGTYSHLFVTGGTANVTSSSFMGSTYSGIYITGGTLNLTSNTITDSNNNAGLSVGGGTVTLTRNNIYGNNPYGLYNDTSTVINAENNWWGHSSGPSPYGSGNSINTTTYIDADPWASTSWPYDF